MNKYRKTRRKNSKLNSIFRTKKHKILSTKYYGFRSPKHNKTRKRRKVPHSKMMSIKSKFMQNPLNYLPLEDLFLNKNMNNVVMNVNPHLQDQIEKHDQKHQERMVYIQKHIAKPFQKFVHDNQKVIDKIYDEIYARDYSCIVHLLNNSIFSHNLYRVKHKHEDYERIEFKDNCNKRITFFDYNKIAKNYDFFNVFHSYVDSDYFIFSVDLHGNNHCHIFVKKMFENRIKDIEMRQKQKLEIRTHEAFNIVSSNSNGNFIVHEGCIYFISISKNVRYNKLMTYNLETRQIKTIFVNHEKHYFMNIMKTNDKLFVNISRYDGNSLHFVESNKLHTIIPFRKNFYYEIEFMNNTYYVLERSRSKNTIYKTHNFKTKTILHKSKNNVDVFNNLFAFNTKYLLCTCDRYNETYLVIIDLCKNKTKYLSILSRKALGSNSTTQACVNRKLYKINYLITPNSYSANDLYLFVSSYLMPQKTLYIHLEREVMHLLDHSPKNTNMLLHSYYHKNYELSMSHTFPEDEYEDNILYIPNTPHVAVYIMYRKGLILNNKNKCFLMGYGAYGVEFAREYNSRNGGAMYYASLMDRGFVVALAFIRGGNFGGFKFHDEGRMKHRQNVYDDFIKVAKYLIHEKITESSRLAIYGRSAGGLLIGNVINMEPELCNLAILGVPFVMPYNVMIDERNPLAYESHYEFGNPYDPKQRAMIKKQSPYLQVKKDLKYPHIFMYANIYDSLTPYTEGFNLYHKLKECDVFKSNQRDLIYHLNTKYGHTQASKSREQHREFAIYMAIILKYIK